MNKPLVTVCLSKDLPREWQIATNTELGPHTIKQHEHNNKQFSTNTSTQLLPTHLPKIGVA